MRTPSAKSIQYVASERSPTVKHLCRWIFSGFALLLLCACGQTLPVIQTKTVEVKVPVVVPIDQRLLLACKARYSFPDADRLTVEAAADRLTAAEGALAICNNQIELIRAAQK